MGTFPPIQGGELSLQGQIPPQPGHFALQIPRLSSETFFPQQSYLSLTFLHPTGLLAAEKFPSSLHLDSRIKLIQRLTEGTGNGCSWLGVTAGGEDGGFRLHQVLHNAEGTA